MTRHARRRDVTSRFDMTDDEFRDFARQTLAVSFPGWLAWLKANSPDVPATIARFARRFDRIERPLADVVVDMIDSGKRERPALHLVVETVANYCERIKQDRAKQEQQQHGRQDYGAVRQAMWDDADGPSPRLAFQVERIYARMSREGGRDGLPCYETHNLYARIAWCNAAKRADGVHMLQHDTNESYEHALREAGFDVEHLKELADTGGRQAILRQEATSWEPS